MKKKLYFFLIILMAGIIIYAGYNRYNYSHHKDLLEKSILKEDMAKAAKNMKNAMRYDMFNNKDDVITLQAIISYGEAKDKFNNEDYTGAAEVLSKIDEKKLEHKNFASNIDAFKIKVNNKKVNKDEVDRQIEEIRAILEVADYKTTKSRAEALMLRELTKEQREILQEMITKSTEELENIKQEEETKKEEEKKSEEEKKLEENKLKIEEIEKEREKEEKDESKPKAQSSGRSKYSRQEAINIFLQKSQMDQKQYKVEIIDSEDYVYNGDLCYFIKVTEKTSSSSNSTKASVRGYYINSYSGEFVRTNNTKIN